MKHVQRLEDVQLEQPSLVTIGVFDGMHRGHQSLIQQVASEAHRSGRIAVVLTFHPHPDVVLRGIREPYYLTSPEQRATLMGELGVDLVVTHPFNETVRSVRARAFVKRLVEHLNMKALWVGKNFALGYQREGNVAFLRELGRECDYEVQTVELVSFNDNGKIINSTLIRQLLREGDVQNANVLLGRKYSVIGEVVHGDQRGRKIGFPTANLAVWEQRMLPAHGVYAGWATLQGQHYMAVTNVGVRPTFEGKTITVETHLLDFDRQIYGERLLLTFEHRLRGERRFSGIDALKAQLQRDVQQGRNLLQGASRE